MLHWDKKEREERLAGECSYNSRNSLNNVF